MCVQIELMLCSLLILVCLVLVHIVSSCKKMLFKLQQISTLNASVQLHEDTVGVELHYIN